MQGFLEKIRFRNTIRLLVDAFWIWWRRRASQLSASLAYYTLISLVPLIIILVAVASLFLDPATFSQEVIGQLNNILGGDNTALLQSLLTTTYQSQSNFWAGLVGFILLTLSASGLFRQVHYTLNLFWELQINEISPPEKEKKPILQRMTRAIINNMILRLKAAVMVFIFGGLILLSTLIASSLHAIERLMGDLLSVSLGQFQFFNLLTVFGMVTVLYALLYRYIPQVNFPWRDVWQGALVGSFLFTALQYLIGLYLGNANLGSAYGAAGSLVVLLFWVYYANQAMFFGAAVVAAKHGLLDKETETGQE
jgi:membrane protein